jgi:FMN-dependent NADH-azoreductase
MARLLYIEASPRKTRSTSIELAAIFRDAYLNAHPGDEIRSINLWSLALPEINCEVLNAKYAVLHGLKPTAKEAEAWQDVVRLVDQFKAADKYIFGVPMWNFSIPYKLKHYLDVIIQPGHTFSFSPQEGYRGLVTGKPVVVIYARGGSYTGEAAAMDMQKSYMELALEFIGFTDIRSVIAEPTLGTEEEIETGWNKARQLAERLARDF